MKRFFRAFVITLLLPAFAIPHMHATGWKTNADGTTGWKTLSTIGAFEGILFIAACREAMKSGEVKSFGAFSRLCLEILEQLATSCSRKSSRTSLKQSMKQYPITSTFVYSLIGSGLFFAGEQIVHSQKKVHTSLKIGAFVFLVSNLLSAKLDSQKSEARKLSALNTKFAQLQKNITTIESKLYNALNLKSNEIKREQNDLKSSLHKQLEQLDKALVGTQKTVQYLGANVEKLLKSEKPANTALSENVDPEFATVQERITNLESAYEEISKSLQTLQVILEENDTKSEYTTELLSQLEDAQRELKILGQKGIITRGPEPHIEPSHELAVVNEPMGRRGRRNRKR
jgi:hypothetical protein